jgi:hypothetical protein
VDLKFLANTVHKFQGDEREVMLFSPVVSKGIQEKTLVWLQNTRYLFNEEDQYILDFALFDGERKLDIEVDGEHYHRNWDGDLCRRDQIRNQSLIELGWDVM